MANEIRKRANFTLGLVADAPLLIGATTLNSSQLANLPTVGATEHMALILDPEQTYGAPEIVWVTSHGSGATSATIVRAREGSVARQHGQGTRWVHGPVVSDFIRSATAADRPTGGGLPYPGEVQYDQDTDQLVYWNNTAWVPVGQASRSWTIIEEQNPNAATVDFQNIPATFTDLQVLISGRGNAAGPRGWTHCRINNDSGANYDFIRHYWFSGVGTITDVRTGITSIECGYMLGTSATANQASAIQMLFPNYSSTVLRKTYMMTGGCSDPGAYGAIHNHQGGWRSTAAINRLTITYDPWGTTWVNGTKATLLGRR